MILTCEYHLRETHEVDRMGFESETGPRHTQKNIMDQGMQNTIQFLVSPKNTWERAENSSSHKTRTQKKQHTHLSHSLVAVSMFS